MAARMKTTKKKQSEASKPKSRRSTSLRGGSPTRLLLEKASLLQNDCGLIDHRLNARSNGFYTCKISARRLDFSFFNQPTFPPLSSWNPIASGASGCSCLIFSFCFVVSFCAVVVSAPP